MTFLALTFYPLGRRARYARQDLDGTVVTRSFNWTRKDRHDKTWDDVPIISPEEFDALYGPRAPQ